MRDITGRWFIFLSWKIFAAQPNQVHQERIVATVQPHVVGQEIPQLAIVEWIQEQIVETIEVVPQERIEVQMNTSSTSTSNTTPVIESVTPATVVAFKSSDRVCLRGCLWLGDTAAAPAGALCSVFSYSCRATDRC